MQQSSGMLYYLQDKFPAGWASESAPIWKPLGLLNLYRVVLAGLFLLLMLNKIASESLGGQQPQLFFQLGVGYLVFTMACVISLLMRWPSFRTQLYTQILLDILFITLMMHASGGVSSGLGMLLVVAVAAGSILSTRRTAVLFAAIATLATLTEQIYTHMQLGGGTLGYTQASMLGAIFFATAILAQIMAKRMLESEALAAQRGQDLAQSVRLTEYVVQRMQTGILVLDPSDGIHLMNESAWYLLDRPPSNIKLTLEQLSPALADQLRSWRADSKYEPENFQPSNRVGDVVAKFSRLGINGESGGTLIFLEDLARLSQQAQHLKLASLGKLTASIAHEIRNPLGAISHASQLLTESAILHDGDLQLTRIIREQTQRMNTIIENVLTLSRRNSPRLVEFPLKPWLEKFVAEFTSCENMATELIAIDLSVQDIVVCMDASQLHQVLWNLCQNGLRYAAPDANPKLKIGNGILVGTYAPFLDVIDFGPGIAPEVAEHIFEPFYTTETSGTGLGLYIARELCECNQARLSYIALSPTRSCFRITFADPRRRQLI